VGLHIAYMCGVPRQMHLQVSEGAHMISKWIENRPSNAPRRPGEAEITNVKFNILAPNQVLSASRYFLNVVVFLRS
jgi:hypothetical protein